MAADKYLFKWGDFSPVAFRSIRDSVKRINLWEGSVRSGKTIASIVRWLDFVRSAPREGILGMSGKTERTLRRNILDPIQDMVGNQNANYNRGTGLFNLFGREIEIVGANDERAQDKIRGATVAGWYHDETTLAPESFYTMLLSRMSVEGAKLFTTTNPDSPYHWLKKNYIDRRGLLDLAVFHFTLDDNPNLNPDYVRSIKAEYTGLWYKRFILGKWVMAEGAIYDQWDERRYVRDVIAQLIRESRQGLRPRPAFSRHFVAVDYGTHNPCTFGLYGFDKKPPVYLVKEYYWDSEKQGRQKTDAEYVKDFQKWLGPIRPGWVYVDPSALSFIGALRQKGYNVIEAENSVVDGIRFVGSMLNRNLFFVDRRCRATIEEFSGYCWDSKAQERGEDKPIKTNDHAMDRNRYGLYTHFFRSAPQFLKGFNYN